jgi:hypothetical protein
MKTMMAIISAMPLAISVTIAELNQLPHGAQVDR